MTRDMKDSGIEWAKTIPNNWRVKRIKYLMKELKNKTSNGCEERALSVTQDKGIIPSIEANIANPSSSYENYMEVKKGDLIFNKYKAHSGVFFVTQYDGIVTFNYSIYRCFKGVNSKYCEYLFKTSGCISEFKQRLHGVGESISPLYTKDLFDIAVIMPPFEEQNRIVNFLDVKCGEIDALSEDIQSEIDILHAYKQSVITEAVTKGLDKNAQMKDSGSDWLGSIPENWDIKRGKYIFEQKSDKGNSKSLVLLSPTQNYGVIPQEMYEELSGFSAVKLNEKTDFNSLKTVHKGAFVISLRSFQGGFEYSEYEGVVSPAYQVFYPTIPICDGYYKYLFKTQIFIDKMNSYTMSLRDGKNIAFADFGRTYIPLPPVEDQFSIAQELDNICLEINTIIDEKNQQLDTLSNYKKSMIYEYATGKKEVSDGEF